MYINNQQYRINVQILLMEHEIQVTKIALAGLLQQMDEGDSISVLLNGSTNQEFGDLCKAHSGIFYYESPNNLGVAGGRNFLLQTSEARLADIIMFVDNDVVVPIDYVYSSAKFLIDRPDSGVVGVTVLKYSNFLNYMNKVAPPFEGYFGAEVWPILNIDIRKFSLQNDIKKYLFHIGTNPDWEAGYVHNADTLDRIKVAFDPQQKRNFYHALASDDRIIEKLQDLSVQSIEISNVAGCCQTFRRSLVEEIGYLNPLFSPYGFEDVDFCTRAMSAGYKNMTSTNSFLIHGTDQRHKVRSQKYSIHTKLRNDSRCRTIFEYLKFPQTYLDLATKRITCNYVLEQITNSHRSAERLAVEIAGIKDGVRQLVNAYGVGVLDHGSQNQTALEKIAAKYQVKHQLELGSLDLDSTLSVKEMAIAKKSLIAYQHERLRNQEIATLKLSSPVTVKSQRQLDKEYPKRLQRFHNLYAGRRCFIIGNGPSLKKTDLSLLKREITFGVNSLYLMTDMIGFRPTYYVVEDNHVVEDNLERINLVQAEAKFFPDKYVSVIEPKPNIFFLPTDWSCYFKSKPQYQNPDFSDDITQRICTGQTVTYLNLQLAYYMGFSEIYLIGLDFSYDIPKTADIEGLTIISNEDDPNHFHPGYFGKGKKWHFPKLNSCLNSYRNAKSFCENHGRTIYNATIGGRLNIYPRVDYYSLFANSIKLISPNRTLIYLLHLYLESMNRSSIESLDKPQDCYFLEIFAENSLNSSNVIDLETSPDFDTIRLLLSRAEQKLNYRVVSLGHNEIPKSLISNSLISYANINDCDRKDLKKLADPVTSLDIAVIDFNNLAQDTTGKILELANTSIAKNAAVFIDNFTFQTPLTTNQGKFLRYLLEATSNPNRYIYVFNSTAVLIDKAECSFAGSLLWENIKEIRALNQANPLHIIVAINEKRFSTKWFVCPMPQIAFNQSKANISNINLSCAYTGLMLTRLAEEHIPFVIQGSDIFFQLTRQ